MAEPKKGEHYEDVDTQLLRDYPELAVLIEKKGKGE